MINTRLFTLILIILLLAACAPASDAPADAVQSTDSNAPAEQEVNVAGDDDMAAEPHDDDMAAEPNDDDMAAEPMDDDMATEPHDDDMAAEPMDDVVAAEPEDDTAVDSAPVAPEEMAEEPAATQLANLPEWQRLPLTNAQTGETFMLADFAGKTVFVEPMATWCTNCRRQLGNVREASAQFGDEVVFVMLSVETNLEDYMLADYATAQQFPFTFAVMSPQMLTLLVDQFGRVISNPPSTPHFIIRPDGSTTELVTGIEPGSAVYEQIVSAGGG